MRRRLCCLFFFFNDTATTEIYTLSLHDALPILRRCIWHTNAADTVFPVSVPYTSRSEEHTSELQSPDHLVCRLLLEKKINNRPIFSGGLKDNVMWLFAFEILEP